MNPPVDPKQQAQIDATEARTKRCEPVAKKVLQLIVDENLLLADVPYLESLVRSQFEAIVKHLTFTHMQEVFNMIQKSLEYSVNNANDALWGKPARDVTIRDVDNTLKNAHAEKLEKAREKEGL